MGRIKAKKNVKQNSESPKGRKAVEIYIYIAAGDKEPGIVQSPKW